jgi:hypothetical protein
MPDHVFFDADFGATNTLAFIKWAGYPSENTKYPKIMCGFRENITTHIFYGYATGYAHGRLFPREGGGIVVNAYLMNGSGTDVAPGNSACHSITYWGPELASMYTRGNDSTLGYRITSTPRNYAEGQFFAATQLPEVQIADSGAGCVPTYIAGDQDFTPLNYGKDVGLPIFPAEHDKFYGVGYSVSSGGTFNGYYTKLSVDYSGFIYVTTGVPTGNVNNYPQDCFSPNTPPTGFTAAQFFGALLDNRSSNSGTGSCVSAQCMDSQIMAVAIRNANTDSNNTKNFRVVIIRMEAEERIWPVCDPDNVLIEWRVLYEFDIALPSSGNTASESRWSLVPFNNGFILAVALNYTATNTAYQTAAFISDQGQIIKFTFGFAEFRTFTNGANFIGLFIGPNGELMYGIGYADRIQCGATLTTIVDPFPPDSTAKMFAPMPVSGIDPVLESESQA